jgi:PqqD family protein of HPr-rel-A system
MATEYAPYWTNRRASILAPAGRQDVVQETLDGEAVLFDRRTGDMHRLNKTALAVWNRCDGYTTMRRIADQLAEQFEVEFDVALDDVEQLVTLLAEAGLLNVGRTDDSSARIMLER